MRSLANALVLWLLLAGSAAADVTGPALVVDGDTLEVAGRRLRLFAVDAPEAGQLCARRGVAWACGSAATRLLRELTDGRQITCVERGPDPRGATAAKCKAGWLDLGAEMVTRGLAVPDLELSHDYLRNYREARGKGNGIFGGLFVAPAAWREGRRLPLETRR